MTAIRYGAKPTEARKAAEKEGRNVPVLLATGVTAIWETDPDVVAAVLPPPLQPTDRPLVRATISQVDLATGPLGAGSVAVSARHGNLDGHYPLVMPMTTERALIGGREIFGEPKKLGRVTVEHSGENVTGALQRHGIDFVEITGTVTGELDLPEPAERLDFYFKFLPAVDGSGFDGDPLLVHCTRTETVKSLHRVDGQVILRESAFDPVADLPVRKLVEITVSEKHSDQRGQVVERVPAEDLLPYVHQRFDDAQQVFDLPPTAAAASR